MRRNGAHGAHRFCRTLDDIMRFPNTLFFECPRLLFEMEANDSMILRWRKSSLYHSATRDVAVGQGYEVESPRRIDIQEEQELHRD